MRPATLATLPWWPQAAARGRLKVRFLPGAPTHPTPAASGTTWSVLALCASSVDRCTRRGSVVHVAATDDCIRALPRAMLLEVSVLARHPVFLPQLPGYLAISGEAPRQPQLTRALHPDPQIVEVRQLPAAGVDPIHDHDSSRRHLTHSSHLVGGPVVTAVSRSLAATKRLEHLMAKSLPVEVAPNGLLRCWPERPSHGRQEEVVDFHDRRGHMERGQPPPEVIGKTALSRAAGTIDRH